MTPADARALAVTVEEEWDNEVVPNALRSLAAQVEALQELLFERGAMEDAPCFVCGYNGQGYFQPDKHACAARHHEAIDRAREAT